MDRHLPEPMESDGARDRIRGSRNDPFEDRPGLGPLSRVMTHQLTEIPRGDGIRRIDTPRGGVEAARVEEPPLALRREARIHRGDDSLRDRSAQVGRDSAIEARALRL